MSLITSSYREYKEMRILNTKQGSLLYIMTSTTCFDTIFEPSKTQSTFVLKAYDDSDDDIYSLACIQSTTYFFFCVKNMFFRRG